MTPRKPEPNSRGDLMQRARRGLPFNAAMLAAYDGLRKTQSRRVMIPQPEYLGDDWFWRQRYNDVRNSASFVAPRVLAAWAKANPYGQPGDILYVQEALTRAAPDRIIGGFASSNQFVRYASDQRPAFQWGDTDHGVFWKWKPAHLPSIFMPKWAARRFCEIISVRPERLQSIHEADTVAEGIERGPTPASGVEIFRALWDDINAARGHAWALNRWVWRIEFSRREVW